MLTENKNPYVFGSLQATSTISTEFLGTDIPGLLLFHFTVSHSWP